MEKKNGDAKKVKVRLNKGRIYTIEISRQTDEFIEGTDKFGYPVKVRLEDVQTIIPMSGCSTTW